MAGVRQAVGEQRSGGLGIERTEADAAGVRRHLHQGIKPIEASGAVAAHLNAWSGRHRGRHRVGAQGAGREISRHEHVNPHRPINSSKRLASTRACSTPSMVIEGAQAQFPKQ